MIKTPVRFDRELNLVVDSSGKYIFDVLSSDATTLEVVKRINLHEDLVKELDTLVQIVSSFSGIDSIIIQFPKSLLEKCRE